MRRERWPGASEAALGYRSTDARVAPLTGEAAEVVGLEAKRHAGAGLASQPLEDVFARCTEHLVVASIVSAYARAAPLGDHLHMQCHRVSVRVDLDDRDFHAVLAGVLVNAITRGSFVWMKSTRPGTRSLSASTFPGLSRFVAMKMNGPATAAPFVWTRDALRALSMSVESCPHPAHHEGGSAVVVDDFDVVAVGIEQA